VCLSQRDSDNPARFLNSTLNKSNFFKPLLPNFTRGWVGLYLVVFEKTRASALPARLLGVAVKRLKAWYSFRKVGEERRGRARRVLLLVGDDESLEAVKALYTAYGYDVDYLRKLTPEDHRVYKFSIAEVTSRALELAVARRLFAHSPLITRDVVDRVARELNIDAGYVRRVRSKLTKQTVIVMVAGGVKSEILHPLGYPVFATPAGFVVPIGVSVEKLRARGKRVEELSSLLKLIRDRCSNTETLEDLYRCRAEVARGYHTMWKALLSRGDKHMDFMKLKAGVLVKMFSRMGVDVKSYAVVKVQARGRWGPLVRRQILELLRRGVSMKEACRIAGVSYATAYHHLREDEEYKRVKAERSQQQTVLQAPKAS
jgi:AcrR family transcriptional regulator